MQILFTADPDILGWLIRYFTKHSWIGSARTSHVALRYGSPEEDWLVETTEKGFCPNWFKRFKTDDRIVFQYEILGDEVVLSKILDDFIEEELGTPYDNTGLLGLFLVILWYWIIGKKIKNPLSIKGYMTCSETVYRFFEKVYKETGIRYFKKQDPEMTFPEELLIECESNPDKFKLAPLNE